MIRLQGTWRLVRRVWADGTAHVPPVVEGVFNIHDGLEQTMVLWRSASGRPASLSQVDEVELTETEFVSTPVVVVFDDGGGNPPTYMFGGDTKRSVIARSAGKISYQHPTHPPFVEHDGDNLTASVPGTFVDHWVRAKS